MLFHPDKNSHPKASEAFKRVSAAYQTLSNSEKRRVYDSNPTLNIFNVRPTPSQTDHAHQYFYAEDFFDPEDLFSQFFGGMSARSQRRQFHHTFTRQSSEEEPRTPPSLKKVILQLLPVILILFMSGIFQSKKEPLYSFNYSNKYNIKMQTKKIRAEFYVNAKFDELSMKEMKEVSNSVERDYFEFSQQKCYEELFK